MPSRIDDLARNRLEKLSRIRACGIDPYPPRYHRSHTIKEVIALFEQGGDLLTRLAGRITASRPMGRATFMDIRDGSGRIQLYLRKDTLGDKYQLLKSLDIGDFIGASGRVFRTGSGEVTLEVADLAILSKSLRPLAEKWHGLTDVEKRYRQRYLDLVSSEEVRDIFFVRSRIITAMRRFLDGRGFLEVETPVLQPVAAGAMARPFSTYHHTLDQTLYLRIATELYLKRLIIGGLDRVYEIGRVFRNEGISTHHNPEFTMLESYEAYADYEDVMEMVEEMVTFIAEEVLGTAQIQFGVDKIDLSHWERITLREAIEKATGRGDRPGIDIEQYPDAESLRGAMARLVAEDAPERLVADWSGLEKMSRGKLIDKLISSFVEPNLIQPTFVLDYPVELSPLAKRKPDNERLVERFEAFCGGMEVANAFTELNDPIEQRERFREQEQLRSLLGDDELERTDDDFLQALEYGMPPTGGLGMGIDRLVMVLTGKQSIREVILFPQLKAKG